MNDLEFDFDYWKDLAFNDPEGYEEAAKAYVYTYIENNYPDDEVRQQRLKGLYWQATNDPDIRKIKDPVVRADRASTKMWMSFRKLQVAIGGDK